MCIFGLCDMKEVLARFTTNSFVTNPYGAIAIATVAGMMFMSVGITAGGPIWLSMVLLIGGILLVYGWLAGSVTYELHTKGIRLRINRFIPDYLGRPPKEKWVLWKDIRSYKNDKDWSRQFKEYEFLKLYLRTSPGEIWLTDQHNKSGFVAFKEAFLTQVKQVNELSRQRKQEEAQMTSASVVKGGPENGGTSSFDGVGSSGGREIGHVIRQRKSFYKTIWAKVITIILLVLTVTLAVYTSGADQKFTHFYRINFVLVPGTIYMIYRVFVKAED